MATTIDLLMKNKNSDGSFTVLHPITKTANVKTSEAIEVMLPSAVGSFKPGDVIQPETSINDIVKKLLQVQILPTYSDPSESIKSSLTTYSHEVGTTISPKITATFTKNDAGALTNHQIFKDGTEVASGTDTTVEYSDSFTQGTATVKYTATATYGDGEIKNDNFGNPYGDTSIKAGSKTSSEISYSGYRKYFYGADDGAAAITTSADIRGLSDKSTKAAAAGTTFTVKALAGDTRVTFAYDASLRDVSSVKYVEAGNDESKSLFTKTTVSVEGANGFEGTDYKVYTMIGDQPFLADMTFAVTI